MLNFILGCIAVLSIVVSLIISAEYNYRSDKPIGHWILGFVAGIVSTIFTVIGIWG